MNRAHLGILIDRMQGTAATAIALVAVVLAFVYLVPRQGDIAASMNARRAAALEDAAAERTAAAAEPDAPPAAAPPPEPASVPDAPSQPAAEPSPPAPETASATTTDARPAASRELLLRPVALDTATILIRQGKVRIAGIRAAPLSKKCGGDGPGGWFCGVEARTHFRSWLRARSIACDVPPGFGEKPEEVEARCDLAGEDIGGWLVANGYAEALPDSRYVDAERQAKAAGRGIWAEARPAD